MKRIAIIGYGAATIGFLQGLMERDSFNSRDYHIDIYDQNKEQNAGGLGGLAYDGKLNVGEYCGSDELIHLDIQEKVLKFFLSHSDYKDQKRKEQEDEFIKKFSVDLYENNMQLVQQRTFHLGTDQLKQVNSKILLNFEKKIFGEYNIKFHFGQKITENDLSWLTEKYDTVIFAVGRYGTNLIDSVIKTYRGNDNIVQSNNKVDIGVRFELPSSIPSIKRLDEALYEWKIKYKTRNNMIVRTFCHNPKGFVVTQNLDILGQKIAIVNGHSKKSEISDNTNFAILATQEFTRPFNDSVLYGKIISQQANLLAGSDNRVILQTLGDFMNKKRSKHLFRVKPTLDKSKYVLGDLTYALPAKTYQALIEFITQLSYVIPEVSYPDNLLYGVETKFYGTKMNNTSQYKFIGDCSGRSRSIIAAASTGYILSKTI